MIPMSAIRVVSKESQTNREHLNFLKPSYQMNTSTLSAVQDVRNKKKIVYEEAKQRLKIHVLYLFTKIITVGPYSN